MKQKPSSEMPKSLSEVIGVRESPWTSMDSAPKGKYVLVKDQAGRRGFGEFNHIWRVTWVDGATLYLEVTYVETRDLIGWMEVPE